MKHSKVKLDPELDPMVRGWPPERRLRLARKIARWARDLEAQVAEEDRTGGGTKPDDKPRAQKGSQTRKAGRQPTLDEKTHLQGDLDRGRADEEFRQKYGHLDTRELHALANESSIHAAHLLTLAWEKARVVPSGN